MSAPSPVELDEPEVDDLTFLARPWVTIVWNDPVNLMNYVSFVFQTYFGYSRKKAEKLMLEVHNDGRSVVSTGSREEMERDVLRAHRVVDEPTLEWLAGYRFTGDVWGYPEGETYFPYSPLMTVESTFAEAVLLETVLLSIYNHDSTTSSGE